MPAHLVSSELLVRLRAGECGGCLKLLSIRQGPGLFRQVVPAKDGTHILLGYWVSLATRNVMESPIHHLTELIWQ